MPKPARSCRFDTTPARDGRTDGQTHDDTALAQRRAVKILNTSQTDCDCESVTEGVSKYILNATSLVVISRRELTQ